MQTITIKQVNELIDKMLSSNIEGVRKHAKTLIGPRTRGSTSDVGLESLPETVELTLFKTHDNGVKIYRALLDNPEFNGKIGVMSLKQALEDGHQVRVRMGDHGPEMYIVGYDYYPEFTPTDHLTVIIGPDDLSQGEEIVHTWFPGPPFERSTIPVMSAVKLK